MVQYNADMDYADTAVKSVDTDMPEVHRIVDHYKPPQFVTRRLDLTQ